MYYSPQYFNIFQIIKFFSYTFKVNEFQERPLNISNLRFILYLF